MTAREIAPFGQWLKEQAAARSMTLSEVARRAGLSKSTLTLAMYGHRPRVQTCRALADALLLPVEQVLRAAGHLEQVEDGFEIPAELWDLVRDLRAVSPEVRRTVIEAWRAALEIARAR